MLIHIQMQNRTRKQQIKTVTKIENKQQQVPIQQNQTGSFLGNMMTGFSLGIGQSIAFNAVNGISNAIFGNKTSQSVEVIDDKKTKNTDELYQQCLYENNLEFEKCEYIKKRLIESI